MSISCNLRLIALIPFYFKWQESRDVVYDGFLWELEDDGWIREGVVELTRMLIGASGEKLRGFKCAMLK